MDDTVPVPGHAVVPVHRLEYLEALEAAARRWAGLDFRIGEVVPVRELETALYDAVVWAAIRQEAKEAARG